MFKDASEIILHGLKHLSSPEKDFSDVLFNFSSLSTNSKSNIMHC